MQAPPGSAEAAAAAQPPPKPANPWARGPPASLQPPAAVAQTAPVASASVGAGHAGGPTIDKEAAPRVGRVHHHLGVEELRELAYQLGIAQQIALQGLHYGLDPVSYQAQLAMSYNLDPSTLNIPGRRPEVQEPPLGQTPYGDDQVYSNIELVSMYPHIAHINQTPILDLRRGVFFLATCPERVVHESVKYSSYGIPPEGVPAMNRAFGENMGHTPVYIVVAATDVGVFSGIAEIMGPPLPTRATSPETSQHRFPVRWMLCKNIPFSHLPQISLRGATPEAEQHRRQGGLLPLNSADGIKAIQVFARVPPGISVLMDFKHYDDAEAKGVVAESGTAAIRKAAHQHSGGNERRGGSSRSSHHQAQHFSSHQSQQHQQGNTNNYNPRHGNQQHQPSSSASAAQSAAPSGGAPSSSRSSSSRGQPRGAPVRRVEASDGERVALQDKFEIKPVQKLRQGQAKKKTTEAPRTDEEAAIEGQTPDETVLANAATGDAEDEAAASEQQEQQE